MLIFLREFFYFENNVFFVSSYMLAMLITIAGFFRYWQKTSEEKKLLLPLIIIFLIGVLHFGIGQYNLYKDIWYFSKPVFYIGAGMLIAYSGLKKNAFLGIIVYVSFALALVHLYAFILEPELLSESINDIRQTAGGGNLLIVFSAAYISRRRRFEQIKNFLNIPIWVFLLILYASLLLSFSRTLLIIYLITMFFLESFYKRKYAVKLIGLLIFIIISFFTASFIFPGLFAEGTKSGELKEKLQNSLTEISIHERYDSDSEIALNWRGYETSLAVEEIKEGTILNKLFGYGFGKTIYIGNTDYLGYDILDIPLLHNGFMEITLKTGFVGLLFYLVFFWNAARIAVRNNEKSPDEANLLLSILTSCFLATLVITGYYNKSVFDSPCIITGYLLSWIIINKVNVVSIKRPTAGQRNIHRDKHSISIKTAPKNKTHRFNAVDA